MNGAMFDASSPLTDSLELAVAWAPAEMREPTWAMLALDARLADIVRQMHEPMLAQLRLAWWRDMLQRNASNRPTGEPLLARLSAWEGQEAGLARMVDGWEELLVEPPLPWDAIARFAALRAQGWIVLAQLANVDETGVEDAGRVVALMDFAAHNSNADEREMAFEQARQTESEASFPRELRSLAVLAGLSRRALSRGGSPLLTGRGDALVAWRLGMFGR